MLLKFAVTGNYPAPADIQVGRSLGRECARSAVPLHLIVMRCTTETTEICYKLPKVLKDLCCSWPSGPRLDRVAALTRTSEIALTAVISGYEDTDPDGPDLDVHGGAQFLADLLADRIPPHELSDRAARVRFPLGVEFAVVVIGGPGRPTDIEELAGALGPDADLPSGARTCLAGPYADTVVALVSATPLKGVAACRAVAKSAVRTLRPARAGQTGMYIGLGRPRSGAHGIRASYEEAREAMEFGCRAGVDALDPYASDLLLHRVLVRDRTAVRDLVASVLLPLSEARQGPTPLLDTLETYFAVGCTATRAAEVLHLSVRAVTYRLARVKSLTSHDVNVPEERFVLETALRGARALNWPQHPLPEG